MKRYQHPYGGMATDLIFSRKEVTAWLARQGLPCILPKDARKEGKLLNIVGERREVLLYPTPHVNRFLITVINKEA